VSGGRWEGWDHDHRISGYWAPRIKAADRRIIRVRQVADSHPGGGLDRARMIARSAIDGEAVGRLGDVLTALHVVGAVFGAKTGLGQVRDAGKSSPVPPPGLVTALDAAKSRGWSVGPGLGKHVDSVTLAGFERRSEQVAREVAANLGDGVAKILAAGWERGDSTDTIARALAEFVDSPGRADRIAVTETARSMVASSFDTYQANGIGSWDWLESPGACPICQRLAAGGPYSLGDAGPPGHPYCRCAPVPRVDVPSPRVLTAVPGLSGLPSVAEIGGIGSAGALLGAVAGVVTATFTAHSGTVADIDMSGLDGEDDYHDEGESTCPEGSTLPFVHCARSLTISRTESRRSLERNGQVSQAGADKMTTSTTGIIRGANRRREASGDTAGRPFGFKNRRPR